MLSENFIFVGLAIGFVGVSSYFVATLKGQVQPNRLSWLIMGIAPLTAFAAELSEGVGLRSLMTFWVGFAPLMISRVVRQQKGVLEAK